MNTPAQFLIHRALLRLTLRLVCPLESTVETLLPLPPEPHPWGCVAGMNDAQRAYLHLGNRQTLKIKTLFSGGIYRHSTRI